MTTKNLARKKTILFLLAYSPNLKIENTIDIE